MLVLLSALIVPVVAVTAQTTQKPVVSRNGAFGFSYVTYSFEPDDGVFPDGFSALWRIPAGVRWAGTEEFPHDAVDHRLTDVKQHLDHTRADQVRLARMRSSTTSAAMLSRSRPTVATATSVPPAR